MYATNLSYSVVKRLRPGQRVELVHASRPLLGAGQDPLEGGNHAADSCAAGPAVAPGMSPSATACLPDPASIRIVTNAVGFCWLVANRVTPADLDLHVTGDPGRAAGVLAAASALALD